MRNLITTLLVAILAASPLNAGLPVCQLGGPTAMDTNRKLAEGETFVPTDRPLIVNLRYRPTKEHPEQVGECMLLSGSVVAVKDGILVWVKACGNDEVNRNIRLGPPQQLTGLPPATLNLTGNLEVSGDINMMHGGKIVVEHTGTVILKKEKSGCRTLCKVLIGAGIVALGGGIYAATRGNSHKGPGATTYPPCTQQPCP